MALSPQLTATFNGTVQAIAYSGTTAFLGGDFTQAYWNGTTVSRTRLAAINVTTGALLPWNPTADAAVRALAASDGVVYAGGDFNAVDGAARHRLAALDATTGTLRATPKLWVSGQVYALGVGNGLLYLAGRISAVAGQARANVAAVRLSTGTLSATWKPAAEDRVEALVVTANRVYLGGIFSNVNGVAKTQKIAAVNPTTGAVDLTYRSRVYILVHGLAVSSNRVYAGTGGRGGRAYVTDLAGTLLAMTTMDGDIQAVAVLGDTVYWGGHFDRVCKSARTGAHGVCLDGSWIRVKLAATDVDGALASWAPQANGVHGVFALASTTTYARVAAGGAFTTIGGTTQRRFAQFEIVNPPAS